MYTHAYNIVQRLKMKFLPQNFNNSEIMGEIYFLFNSDHTPFFFFFENPACARYCIVHGFNAKQNRTSVLMDLESVFHLLTFASLYNKHRLVLLMT